MALRPAPEWTFSSWKVFTAPSRQVVKQAAFVRNLQVDAISPPFYVISDGTREVAFWEWTPETTTLVARRVSVAKPVTKTLLERAGMRVPAGKVFSPEAPRSGWRFAKSIGFPVVVKPTGGSGGSGVTSGITTEDHFRLAWNSARKASRRARVMVERHVPGRDFRLYVVGDRLVAAAWRIPAYVDGDGSSSISELIAQKNEVRRSNPYVGGKAMKLTPAMVRNLREMNLGPDSVLAADRRVTLHPVANIGAGGESSDVTDQIHADFSDIAVRASRALPGAINAGVDLLADDISAPAAGQDWAVCEINTYADVAMHHFPVFGRPRDVAGALIEHLFPGSRRCEPAEQRTVRALISGAVTGVGFRAWIWRRANLRGLTGWVRNGSADSVEAVFSGAPNAVDDMLKTCHAGSPKAVVTDVAVEPATETTAGDFEIRS